MKNKSNNTCESIYSGFRAHPCFLSLKFISITYSKSFRNIITSISIQKKKFNYNKKKFNHTRVREKKDKNNRAMRNLI